MAKTILNPRGIAEVHKSPQVLAALELAAKAAASSAKEIAPVESGDYKDSIGVQAGLSGGLPVAQLQADDWKALWIEVGTSKHPAQAILRKGAESVGLRVKEGEQ